MKLFKFVMFFILFLPFSAFAEDNNIIKENLKKVFLNTFSSSHQFAGCQIFQLLGYDLAEIAQIKRITPYPASLTIDFEGMKFGAETIDFDQLNVICTRVHYFGMIIEKLTFGFPNSAIEANAFKSNEKIRFVKASKITLKAEVSEADLLAVMKLYSKSSLLSQVKISLSPAKAKCNGRVKMGLLLADFEIKGHINQLSSKKVCFIFDKMRINRILQPRAFVHAVMNYINPVFDSSKIWINLNVSDMKIKKGFVETIATIDKKE